MNRFAIGTMPEGRGFIGWFRKVHRSENEIVRENGKPVIYPTRQAAKDGATAAFLAYLNAEMVRDGVTIDPKASSEADTVFANFCRQKGSSKITRIERRALA